MHRKICSFTFCTCAVSLSLPSLTFLGALSQLFRSSRSHICSLSSGKAHPLAEHSEIVADGRNGKDINYSRVCGDYVAARVDFGHISVWNWKTGKLVSHKVRTLPWAKYMVWKAKLTCHTVWKSPDAATPFDFLDEHRILYVESKLDQHYLCVYDFRDVPPDDVCGGIQHLHPVGRDPQRLELPPLPPPAHPLPWHVELCRNTLPAQTGSAVSAPFHANPRERLITVRATNSSIQGESAQHVFHLSARTTLLQYFAAWRGNIGTVPWPAWCGAVHATRDRTLPLVIKSSMLTCGMWAVSHPPDGGKGTLDVDCYLPQRGKVRQSVKIPQELVPDEGGFLEVPWEGGLRRVRCVPGVLSVLCEDAVLLFTVCPSSGVNSFRC